MQPSPKWPYGVPRRPCALSSARKSRRYAPSRAERHGAVLPAGPGLRPVRRARRGTARVLADAPQDALGRRVVDDQGVQRVGRAHDSGGPRAGLGPVGAARLHEEPGAAARQPGGLAHQVGGHALDGQRVMRQQPGRRVGRVALVGVAEDGEGPRAGRFDQPYGRLGQHPERALAAAEGAGQIGAVLGEQGVDRVSGDPARQTGRVAGAQQCQVRVHECAQAYRCAFPAPPEPVGAALVGGGGQPDDVVGRGAPGDRVRAAGVVADHSAERAAAVRGRVGTEGQAVRARRRPQVVEDHAGLDHGGPGPGVQRDDRAHVPGEVEDDAGAGGLSRDGRTSAARHHGHSVGAAHVQYGGHVVGVARGDDTARDPAVVGGVHGRQGAGGDPECDISAHGPAQRALKIVAALTTALTTAQATAQATVLPAPLPVPVLTHGSSMPLYTMCI